MELFLHWQHYFATGFGCPDVQEDRDEADAVDLKYGPTAQDQRILRFFTENPAPLDEYRTVQNCLAVLAAYRQRASMPDYQWKIMSDASGPIIERAFELPLGVVEVGAVIDMPWTTFEKSALVNSKCEEQIQLWYNSLNVREQLCEGLRKGMTHPVFVSHIHIAWSGRIDAIARCNGAVRVVDHKTTSIMGDQFMQDFQISNQVLGYVWAAKQLWPDLDVSAFCLNAIHFKKPTGTGAITSPGPRGGPAALNFVRGYYEYSQTRIDEWEKNALDIVSDFIHCLVRDAFPRHTKWCFGKYGKCQYHDVCVQDDPRVRENMIKSDMFKTVTWNPVAGR